MAIKKVSGKDVDANAGGVPLKEKVRQQIVESGELSQSDLKTMRPPSKADAGPTGAALQEKTVIPTADDRDPIVQAADSAPTPSETLRQDQQFNGAPQTGDLEGVINRRKNLEITPEDKQAFIDALIHHKRMVMSFACCGGAINLIVRSRTVPETRAVLLQQRREIDNGVIKTRIDYNVRVRSMLMAAQIEDLNGTKYPELTEPLFPIANPDGDNTEPAWLNWVDKWAGEHESLHGILWACIEEFEDKYWRMIEDAKQQDFWSPVASTSA